MSYDEFKKKMTNYCIWFGHSLWSASQLPAQEVNNKTLDNISSQIPKDSRSPEEVRLPFASSHLSSSQMQHRKRKYAYGYRLRR